MPFIEQEAKSEYKKIDGKRTHVITPEVEVTLTNTQTGTEYMSDKEAAPASYGPLPTHAPSYTPVPAPSYSSTSIRQT